MRIRIDLKIFIFLFLFYLTNQIKIYLVIMFFCAIHELGHIAIGILLKMKIEKLEILPCGLSISFQANPKDLNHKIKNGTLLELKKTIVALAGPIVSLILTITYIYINPTFITQEDAIYSNMLILIFNMLLIYPLDGGRILKGILYIEFGNLKSKRIVNYISNFTMIIFTISSSIAVYYFKNIAIFLVCLFLWIITLQENKKFKNNMRIYELLENKNS